MTKALSICVLITAAAAAFSLPDLDYLGKGKGKTIQWSLNSGHDWQKTFAGEMNLKLYTAEGNSTFYGFCVDISRVVADNKWGVQILTTDSLHPNGDRIAHIVNTYAPDVHGAGTDNDAMVIQAVVWELLYEDSGTFDLTTGSFRARKENGDAFASSVLNDANAKLADLGTSIAPYYKANLGNNGPVSQSFVAPVPEPGSMLALGLGVSALLSRKLRRGTRR